MIGIAQASINTGLSKEFTVPQVAEKHVCPAQLNRVPFGCSTGVGPEDRTGCGLNP